jgi:hypothetical protein
MEMWSLSISVAKILNHFISELGVDVYVASEFTIVGSSYCNICILMLRDQVILT